MSSDRKRSQYLRITGCLPEKGRLYRTFCHDGSQQAKVVRSEAFDLIILDIMLPVINGLDVCRLIRHSAIPRQSLC